MNFTRNKELASLMLQIDNEIIDYCIRLYDCPSLADMFSSEKDYLVKRELIKNKIALLAVQMILFCHSEDEFLNFHEWRVPERELMSTAYRLKKLQRAGIEERKIRDNLNKESLPNFEKAVERLGEMSESTITGSNFKSLTPLAGETVAQSYERYLYIRKQRKFRNYYELIDTWRTELEKTIFSEVNWSMEKKDYFFKEWENAYFEKPYGRRKGLKRRHPSAHAIDSLTAGQFILFFMQNFIDDPIRIQNAEISCLLWLLIRLTHQNNWSSPFNLDEVVNLPVKEFKIGIKSVTVKNIEINMSNGLINLFLILIYGKKQKDRVFSNITVDSLEASFQKASKIILQGESVAPSAFLSHPHPFLAQKISPPILYAMRNENVLEIQPGNYGGCFLRRFDLPKMKHKHHSTF